MQGARYGVEDVNCGSRFGRQLNHRCSLGHHVRASCDYHRAAPEELHGGGGSDLEKLLLLNSCRYGGDATPRGVTKRVRNLTF